MARKNRKTGELTTEDLLRDKIWKKGETVYIHLFPYNDPDFVQVFQATILSKRTNVDFTSEYNIKITCGFDKREVLRTFFYKNWFKTPTKNEWTSDEYTNYNLPYNDSCNMFNYTETEMAEVIMDQSQFKYSKYKTFFRNYSNQFVFSVNEVFIFDNPDDAFYYKQLHSILAVSNYLRKIHNIMLSDNGLVTGSKLVMKDTTQFVKSFKEPIIGLIQDLGEDFKNYLEDDKKITKFFRNYILLENIRDIDYYKKNKYKAKMRSRILLKRERVGPYENYKGKDESSQ